MHGTGAHAGPHGYVRHPAYLGTILYELVVPVLLPSCWVLIVGGLNVILLILRSALEEASYRPS